MEQAGDDLLAPVGLFGDHRQVFPHLGLIVALFEQQMRVHQDDPQRIIHLVRNACRQLSHAGEFFRLHQRLLGGGQLPVRSLDLFQRLAELIDRVRQAHFAFGQIFVYRDGMFHAGVVAARPAVQFVAGQILAHPVHDRLQVPLGGCCYPLIVRTIDAV